MQFLRLLWAGMKDTYEQFAYFIGLSLVFSLMLLPSVLVYFSVGWAILTLPLLLVASFAVPPSLSTLYALVDPRRLLDHPEWREVPGLWVASFKRSWLIACYTILPLIMIGWNIAYFAGSGHALQMLVPLWLVMWVLLFILTQYCFCLSGTVESGPRNAFRGGMYVLVRYPFRSIFLSIILIVLGYFFTITMLPMVVIGPAFFAAIVTRFVFDALEVYVPDPDSPTDERAWERAHGIEDEKPLVARLFQRKSKQQ